LAEARSAEPSCKAPEQAAKARGASLWPGGDRGRRRLRRSEHETAQALRQQRALSAPARAQRPKAPASEAPSKGPEGDRVGRGDQIIDEAVWSGAARRSATLPSLSAGGRGRTGPTGSPRRSRRGPGWGAGPTPRP